MQFLKDKTLFSFSYGGKAFSELELSVEATEGENSLTRVYTYENKIKFTNILYKRGYAYEWENFIENITDTPSEVITDLCDANVTLPMNGEKPRPWGAYQDEFKDATAIWSPKGSLWCYDEFTSFPDTKNGNYYDGHIYAGESRRFATSGGRSSQAQAPFFRVHKDGMGYIFAIGWTGQWNFEIIRGNNDVTVKSKIEDTEFRLLPGEKFRTSSFVMMPYTGSVEDSVNLWRRMVKKYFSLMGKPGRDEFGPLCANVWGGMKTPSILQRLNVIKENNLPFEYVWMDAGWYGEGTNPSPDEFEGDWAGHTGDWQVSSLIHTNGLRDVTDAVHNMGMKFILWFEPERVKKRLDCVKEHPDYFLESDNIWSDDVLLNLGNEDAWSYCFENLSSCFESIGVDFYRQDFNIDPLAFWRKNDAPDRKGISEIKHINGLYRLWDALLEKFPHLVIDNCASGGRRIDIETLRRSMPLWRSDYQCPANYEIVGTQCHNLSFNAWMPYSGTGSGRMCDTYRMRSAYGGSLATNYTYSEREAFGDDPEKLAWIKAHCEEYLKVRPYMSEDFYALTEISERTDIWAASQFDRPEKGDGLLLLFRREKSPYFIATFELRGLDADAEYVFTDVDSGEEKTFTGKYISENGYSVSLPKRGSAIVFYKKK